MKKTLKKIAKNHGVPVEEVKREIEKVLAISRNSKEPLAQEFWKDLPSEKGNPTTEDELQHLLKRIQRLILEENR